MAVQLQLRRGTNAENNAFTGALGETTVDTTNKTLRVHDGLTAGGFEIVNTSASQTLTNKTLGSPSITGQVTGNIIPSVNEFYDLGSSSNRWNELYLAGSTIYLGDATISFDSGSGSLSISYNGNNATLPVVANQTFATLDGTETLTNKTLTSPTVTGGSIDNTPIGVATPNTGNFTTLITTGDVEIGGNLVISGTTTTIETANIQVEDTLIELNYGASSSVNDSGILINRGSTGDNVAFVWDETTDKFKLGTTTATGSSTGSITITTGTLVANVEGDVTGNVTGNASTATTWATARDLSLTGDATATLSSVDGSANVSAALTLTTVNSNVGEFGSATSIPVVTVNEKGLVTAVSTATVSSTLPIAGDTGTDNVSLLTDTLTFTGSAPIVTAVTDNTVTVSANDATTTTKGVASFADADFTVSTGAVSIKNVNLGTQTSGNYVASLVAGTGISVDAAAEGGTPTITNTDLGSSQAIFKNVAVSGQTTIVADSNNDTLTVAAGTGISLTTNATTDTLTITNSAPDQTVTLTGAGATSISGTYPNFTISSTNTTYSQATSTVLGLVKLGSNTQQTVAPNAVTDTASRSYAVQLNSSGQMLVNVPWVDTNTTYVAGNGLTLSGTTFDVGAGSYITVAADTVSVNATSANTASTVVARDASGNFSAGTITATDFNSTSDIKFKTDVETIESALEKVSNLRGVNFTWKDSGKAAIGVIAQEVEPIIPEVVSTSEEGDKSVNYSAMVGLLIEAIKEQQNQIDDLRAQLNSRS